MNTLDHTRLLQDFLLSPADLFSLAQAHNLSLDALIAWWSDPATKARIRALEEIAEARRDLRAKLHATKAIDRLSALSESTGNQPYERRHAANAVLKHAPTTRQPPKPGRAADSRAADSRATGFGASQTPVEDPPARLNGSRYSDPPARASANRGGPSHEDPSPNCSHTSPTHDPTHSSHESYGSHASHPSPVQSPLTHDAPPRDQGRHTGSPVAAHARPGGACDAPSPVLIA